MFFNLKKVGPPLITQIRDNMKVTGGYLWYLQNFDHFHEIPVNLKQKEYRKYRRYLDALIEYLSDFFRRTQPLADFSIVEKQINDDFAYKWKEGTVRGWEQLPDAASSDPALHCDVCEKQFTNVNTYMVCCSDLGTPLRQETQEKSRVI